MKRVTIILCALAIVVIACQRRTAPTVTTRTEQPPPPKIEVPVTAVATYAAADITAGKTIYETKCTRCHGAKPVDNYTEQRWPGILRSMVPRSKLDSTETKQLTAYVMTNAKKS